MTGEDARPALRTSPPPQTMNSDSPLLTPSTLPCSHSAFFTHSPFASRADHRIVSENVCPQLRLDFFCGLNGKISIPQFIVSREKTSDPFRSTAHPDFRILDRAPFLRPKRFVP